MAENVSNDDVQAALLEMKAEQVAQVQEKLQKAQSVVIFDYRGLTVEEVTALRVDMRKAGVEYVVLKNAIVERAGYDPAIVTSCTSDEYAAAHPEAALAAMALYRMTKG